MPRKLSIFLVGIFFIKNLCFGASLLETEKFALFLDVYLRNDLITFKNVVDLDSHNKDDHTVYFGIDYNLGFKSEFKTSGQEFYLKLERNGPSDYGAPLWVHNTLMTSGGVIDRYCNDKLLPQLEEFWFDTPLFNFGFKVGLYTYEVGNGFSLNGSFENYGFTFYKESADFLWRLYYCRPELVYKNRLGPNVPQDKEQGFDHQHNAANFFATDIKFNLAKNCLNPYLGALIDYTSSGKRNNVFTTPTKKDILGTLGFAFSREQDNLSLNIELAHNFGKAKSENPEYKDVYHTGYLAYTEIDYHIKQFIPHFQFLLCSGNKTTPEMAQNQDSTLTSSKNRAFSYYSPLNNNLGDSISGVNASSRPLVAMGSGFGLNYGIPRPGTFSASDFDNLLMPSLGFNWEITQKTCLGFDVYYIQSFAKPVGTFEGEGKYLSRQLGYEVDLSVDYQLNKNILISFLGGYFLPGKFYKEKRDDTAGSIFSPFLRGDGKANSAYQIELSVEFMF
jgi:hypothetical protein